ncbi:MAG: phenylalanine--tRNA ligase subunit beta [Desulfovibrionales bacterium]
MRLSLDWLRELTPYEGTVQNLADTLTMLGLEVEEAYNPFPGLGSVVVGHVVERTPHPQADKLSLCRVDVGTEILEIVCGAPNVAQGQNVPVALVGATLPGGLTIKKAKIRGQHSFGMICSEKELELGEGAGGIMVLDPDLPIGTPLVQALNLETTVLDVSITPNRADCLSILGLAREVAAAFELPLSIPHADLDEQGPDCRDEVEILIPEPQYCPLYQARIIRNVAIGPSPAWMRYRLLALGLRPINNIVDVTNYILMELGQPMHAFDEDLLTGRTVKVARAAEGMQFTTLDNQKRTLTAHDLLIWDGEKPVGLAGVMGGANSEIHVGSRNVLLECAVFDPATIRKTARRLGLSSEASYRFERGVDQPGSILALNRGAGLMAAFGGGVVLPHVATAEPVPYKPRTIRFRPERSRSILALDLADEFCERTLSSLGCELSRTGSDEWKVTPPSYRNDLEREIDLIEEVGRVYGMDRIPSQLPSLSKRLEEIDRKDQTFDFLKSIKTWARGLGLNESINYSFVSSRELDLLEEPAEGRVYICNPLSEDQNVLRTLLVPGLLQNLRLNLGYGNRSLRLFEVAHTFHQSQESETRTRERSHLGLLLAGRRNPAHWPWKEENIDYSDLKGLVEALFAFLRITGVSYTLKEGHPFLSPCVVCERETLEVGVLGRLKSRVAEEYNARSDVWLAELDLELLADLSRQSAICFRNLPTFPPVRRDVTVIAPMTLHMGRIMETIHKVSPTLLEDVQLVDIYQESADAHERNLTLRLTYRHPERTLKDTEVDKVHQKLAQALLDNLPIRYQ